MNVRQQVEVKNKKNNDFLSLPCNPTESLVSIKENTEKKEKKERKKNTDRTQIKLNAPHVMYNVKILPQ